MIASHIIINSLDSNSDTNLSPEDVQKEPKRSNEENDFHDLKKRFCNKKQAKVRLKRAHFLAFMGEKEN